MYPAKVKDPVTSAPVSAEPVTLSKTPTPSPTAAAARRRYEELDGDTLEYPSTFSSSVSSEGELVTQPLSNRAASEQKEQPKSYFSLRRFSTPPLTSPLYRPIDPGHASLPSFPRFGLSKTCKALKRRCTVTGSTISYNEHSRLTSPAVACPLMPEEPIPLAPLNYGSSISCQQPLSPKPCLHFTMAFSPEEQTLAVSVLRLSGTPHRLEDVSVLGRLPPLYPCPLQASAQKSLSPEADSLLLLLKVGSVEELQRCVLKLTVYTQKPPSLRSSALGELEAECGGREWRGENPFFFRKELNQKKWKLQEQDQSSNNSATCKASSSPPQIFVLLQYQTLTHRIKATLLRADNLDTLAGTSAPAEFQVLVALHHEGAVISSRETKGASWNSSFVFDLPPGDISKLPLMLEFVIVQHQAPAQRKVLGRVQIGAGAADAGRAHWRDVCILHVEQPRWHVVQPEVL
ncbi:uncharacterized protein [Takifugu rubripes]|uniref:uncharacterized protein n=1 Tax=Takifugu rubripes TaxID=31033 RepID=UPI001145A4B8|nr:uncharacterized protein LOC115251043 [Takifugu rubripes]